MRIRDVLQIHFVDRFNLYVTPLLVLGAVFALMLVIGGVVNAVVPEEAIPDVQDGMRYNGAIYAVLSMGLGIGGATMTQYLAFALGFGLTRREYMLGSGIVFVVLAASVAALVTVLKVIEVATNGWGLRIRMFDTVHTGMGPWWQTLVQTFLIMLVFQVFSACVGSIWNRWGTRGITILIGAGVVLVGVLVLALLLVPGFASSPSPLEWPWAGQMGLIAAVTAVASLGWGILGRSAQVR